MAACRKAYRFTAAFAIALASACGCTSLGLAAPAPAFAATKDDLALNYQLATSAYEQALVEQTQNEQAISDVEGRIESADREFELSKDNLADSAAALYKNERNRAGRLDVILSSESLGEAIMLSENYARIENYWSRTVENIRQQRVDLNSQKKELEDKRGAISDRIFESGNAVAAAEAALKDADHSDGAQFHQKQGNGSNCGATSFIVGVNILLHESRYPNNVEVWKGAGFNGDSTQSLGFKGATWLMANGLADQISCTEVDGDIHYADQLAAELEMGNVVVISSGSGSVWQRADGTSTGPGTFPDGHWIVFYHYEDGVFYANDSSVKAEKGAGCAYTTEQMQQWLNGRGNHFATVLSKKYFG